MKQVEGQMGLFDQDMQYGKMFPEQSVVTKGKTTELSSKSFAKSKMKEPLFLDLRGGWGTLAGTSWVTGIPLHGESSMHAFGESPSVVEESGLSQILEEEVPLKYFLSATACRGVLQRAEKRGKALPGILGIALKQQIERWEKFGTPLPQYSERIVEVEGVDVYNSDTTGNVNKTLTSASSDSHHVPCVCYAIGNGQVNQLGLSESARTLDCMHDKQAILINMDPIYLVRRLTPLEYCRLQGMPDWWIDGTNGSDAAQYKMWGNGMALPNALYVMEGFAEIEGDTN